MSPVGDCHEAYCRDLTSFEEEIPITGIPSLGDIHDVINEYIMSPNENTVDPKSNLVAGSPTLGPKVSIHVRPISQEMADFVESSGDEDSEDTETTEKNHDEGTNMEVDTPKRCKWADYANSNTSDSESDLELVEAIHPNPTATLHYVADESSATAINQGVNLTPTILKFQGNVVTLNPKKSSGEEAESGGDTDYRLKEATTIYFDNGFRYELFRHDGFEDTIKIIYRYPKNRQEYALVTCLFIFKSPINGITETQVNLFLKPFTNMGIHVNEL